MVRVAETTRIPAQMHAEPTIPQRTQALRGRFRMRVQGRMIELVFFRQGGHFGAKKVRKPLTAMILGADPRQTDSSWLLLDHALLHCLCICCCRCRSCDVRL